ncbi:MAG: penicillin-binding transpeptidase domain-containing protein, partial [Pseudomonadota bacterium]
LIAQGNARIIHTISIPSYRGIIFDRREEPLAVSTPTESAWIDPRHFNPTKEEFQKITQLFGLNKRELKEKIAQNKQRAFLYLKRDVPDDIVATVRAMRMHGLYFRREYRRFYPSGPDAAQLIGFTNIDDQGQAGLELYFDDILKPISGKKRVLEDRSGKWIQDLENIQAPHSGQDIILSIDTRIQSHILRVLSELLTRTQAKSATCVMIDITTGEILAMLTAPSFNANNRQERQGPAIRLRAITDPVEPGSTVKAFTIAAGLEEKIIKENSLIDTSPGTIRLGPYVIHDDRNWGVLRVYEILSRSSNVGICKIALELPPNYMAQFFDRFGFGRETGLKLPGESKGSLPEGPQSLNIQASLGFGYGLSVTPLQLAHAYATLGAKGIYRPLSITRLDTAPAGTRILSEEVSTTILSMLAEVTRKDGTGRRANISGYPTAGKTGTVRVIGEQGYDVNRHFSLFAGVTPLHNPRLATLVLIEEPQKAYMGGAVAAPTYAKIVQYALYMLNIPPESDYASKPLQ